MEQFLKRWSPVIGAVVLLVIGSLVLAGKESAIKHREKLKDEFPWVWKIPDCASVRLNDGVVQQMEIATRGEPNPDLQKRMWEGVRQTKRMEEALAMRRHEMGCKD